MPPCGLPKKSILEVESYMKSIDGIMKTFPEMLMNFPLWKYVPPRWCSLFRKAEDHNNVASDFVKGKISTVHRVNFLNIKPKNYAKI